MYLQQCNVTVLQYIVHIRAVEGSRNSCEIDVFWSRIGNPDEESYDPMVTTAIMQHLTNISDQSDFLSLLLARGQFLKLVT